MIQPISTAHSDVLLDALTAPYGRGDPYPIYAALRETAPMALAPDGAVVLTRYADCLSVVRDRAYGHLGPEGLDRVFGPDWRDHIGIRQMMTSLLGLNPPDHTRLRALVAGAFTAHRVQALRPAIGRLVEAALDELSDAASGGEVDFAASFAFPLPVNVIGELLGVPAEDRLRFRTLVRDATAVLDLFTPEVLVRADAAAQAIRDYFLEEVRRRRRHPGEDLLSALVLAEESGDRLSEDELLSTAALLFAAGFETTTSLLGNGLVALAARPEETRQFRDDPGVVESGVEELIRFDSPVQIVGRTALADVVLGGMSLPRGTRVISYVGAANRDPAQFPNPDRLDLRRKGSPPMSFGGGIHYCLGAPLARLEAQLAFPALLRRFPNIELADRPVRRDSLTLRGFTSVPVRLGGVSVAR